jgi:hypothetical protein
MVYTNASRTMAVGHRVKSPLSENFIDELVTLYKIHSAKQAPYGRL